MPTHLHHTEPAATRRQRLYCNVTWRRLIVLKVTVQDFQQDVDNLLTLFDVYDTLPLRPNGIEEGENWVVLDQMKPLGQQLANALWAPVTRAISLDSTIAGRGVPIWFDTKMETSFLSPLASLIPIETIMLACRTALLLHHVRERGVFIG
jgi:hypothetical protein